MPDPSDPSDLEQRIVRDFGFAPQTVSPTAFHFGLIEHGPRKGYLCVYTRDLHVDVHATTKRNFVDADRGYDPSGEDPRWLVYIFAPLRRSSRA